MLKYELSQRNATMRLGYWNRIVLVQWLQVPKMSDFRAIRDCCNQRSATVGAQVGLLSLMLPVADPDSLDGSALFQQDLSNRANWAAADYRAVAATAHVVTVSGLLGATVRTFLGALAMVPAGSKSGEMKVFREVDEGCAWLEAETRPFGAGAGALIAVTRSFCVERRDA